MIVQEDIVDAQGITRFYKGADVPDHVLQSLDLGVKPEAVEGEDGTPVVVEPEAPFGVQAIIEEHRKAKRSRKNAPLKKTVETKPESKLETKEEGV